MRTCFHCEQKPALTGGVLCTVCAAVRSLRDTYHAAGRNPAWDAHLKRLSIRARLKLPLFDGEEPPVRPLRHAKPPRSFA